MSTQDIIRIIETLPSSVYWLTLSGGEPCLKEGFTEILHALSDSKVELINIPTNGLNSNKLIIALEDVLPETDKKFIVNVSVDALGRRNDEIRGVSGAFSSAVATIGSLKLLQKAYPRNLKVGVHTVLSDYNKDVFWRVKSLAVEMEADQWIFEPAEVRDELNNSYLGKTFDYQKVLENFTVDELYFGNVLRKYYVQALLKKKFPPCYAGIVSCQIMPDGEVWACCMKNESFGNLKDWDFNFKEFWIDTKEERKEHFRRRRCNCCLANVFYTNFAMYLLHL